MVLNVGFGIIESFDMITHLIDFPWIIMHYSCFINIYEHCGIHGNGKWIWGYYGFSNYLVLVWEIICPQTVCETVIEYNFVI